MLRDLPPGSRDALVRDRREPHLGRSVGVHERALNAAGCGGSLAPLDSPSRNSVPVRICPKFVYSLRTARWARRGQVSINREGISLTFPAIGRTW